MILGSSWYQVGHQVGHQVGQHVCMKMMTGSGLISTGLGLIFWWGVFFQVPSLGVNRCLHMLALGGGLGGINLIAYAVI